MNMMLNTNDESYTQRRNTYEETNKQRRYINKRPTFREEIFIVEI